MNRENLNFLGGFVEVWLRWADTFCTMYISIDASCHHISISYLIFSSPSIWSVSTIDAQLRVLESIVTFKYHIFRFIEVVQLTIMDLIGGLFLPALIKPCGFPTVQLRSVSSLWPWGCSSDSLFLSVSASSHLYSLFTIPQGGSFLHLLRSKLSNLSSRSVFMLICSCSDTQKPASEAQWLKLSGAIWTRFPLSSFSCFYISNSSCVCDEWQLLPVYSALHSSTSPWSAPRTDSAL